jgi:Protein of unknown function (DUF2934)
MSRDQQIRDVAYAIWESEGRPTGCEAKHWKEAEAQINDLTKSGNGETKTVEVKTRTQRKVRRVM